MGCGMDMCVNWSTSVPAVFFCWWRADTPCRFATSIAVIYGLAVAFELLNNVRSRFVSHARQKSLFGWQQQVTLSLLHTAMVAYGLFLMMIFMTYNGLMMIAMIAGHGSGHLLGAAFLPEADDVSRVKTCCC